MLTSSIVICILVLLFMRVPVFASLLLGTLVPFTLAEGNHAINLLADVFYSRIANYLFVAIPAFALMAQILLRTEAVTDLYNSLYAAVRRIPGAIGMATIASCTAFSAISGSSMATTLTVGGVAIPQMQRFNYPRPLIFGMVAAGGTLGILIPPSIGLIVYGVLANVSIGSLFLAALVPACVMVTFFCLYVMVQDRRTRKDDNKSNETKGSKEPHQSANNHWRTLPILILPVVILGGIYGGLFTATEAAVVAAMLSAIIAAVIYRKYSFAFLLEAARESARTSAKMFLIVGSAAYFSHVLVYLGLPGTMLDIAMNLELGRFTLFALLLCVLLLLGMLMDGMSVTLITTPIIIPVLVAFDYNLIWYGVILILTLEMSLLTPPVGINLYVIKSISDAQFTEVLKGVLPFLLLMLCTLALAIMVPQLVLWLPETMDYSR